MAVAGEPVAAAPGAPLWGRAGGRPLAAVRCPLLRRVSFFPVLPYQTHGGVCNAPMGYTGSEATNPSQPTPSPRAAMGTPSSGRHSWAPRSWAALRASWGTWRASTSTPSTTFTRSTTTWRCWSSPRPCAAAAWCAPSACRGPRREPPTVHAASSQDGARCAREVGARRRSVGELGVPGLVPARAPPPPRAPPAGSMARQLQQAAVRVLSERSCRRFYPVQISSRMLCAGSPQGGVDSCSVSPLGDSLTQGHAHPGCG